MSLFSKHTNIKYNKKLFKITNTIRYSIWQKAEVSQEHLEYLPKIQIGNKMHLQEQHIICSYIKRAI